MIRILTRGSLRPLVIWPLGLLVTCMLTASAINDFYASPLARSGYASAIGTTPVITAISGSGSGLDSLGGIIANELAIILFSGLAIAGIMVATMLTRGNEDAGRLDLITARPVSRLSALHAAVIITAAMLFVMTAGVLVCFVAIGVPLVGPETGTSTPAHGGALLYAGSVGAYGLVWCGLGFVCGEIASDTQTARKIALSMFFGVYALRIVTISSGIDAWWATPLGWFDRVEPFAHARILPLVSLAVLGIALIIVATVIHSRRDCGTGLISGSTGSPHGSRRLVSPGGLFLRLTRSTRAVWVALGLGCGAMFGFLLPEWIDVVELNLDSLHAFGLHATTDSISAMMGLLAALFGAACGISMVSTSASEETEGRLSFFASRPVTVSRIWQTHIGLACGAALLVTVVTLASYLGSATLSTAHITPWATARDVVPLALPVVLYPALAAALHGYRRSWHSWVWVIYGCDAIVVFLGDMMSLPAWLTGMFPINSLGTLPGEPVDTTAVAIQVVLMISALMSAVALMRRRDLN